MPIIIKRDLMLNKILPLFFLFLFLVGCSKTAMDMFSEDKMYQKGLEHTQVGDIVQSLETKAIVNATYLNMVESKWQNEMDNFLVGLYIANSDNNKFIENKNFILTLNGKSFEKIEELQISDAIYPHIPLKNPHAKYYMVSFKKDKSETLKLQYTNSSIGGVDLDFQVEK